LKRSLNASEDFGKGKVGQIQQKFYCLEREESCVMTGVITQPKEKIAALLDPAKIK